MSIILILLGAGLIYFGATIKLFKNAEGKTVQQYQEELGKQDVRKVAKTGFATAFRLYGKFLSIAFGILFVFLGIIGLIFF